MDKLDFTDYEGVLGGLPFKIDNLKHLSESLHDGLNRMFANVGNNLTGYDVVRLQGCSFTFTGTTNLAVTAGYVLFFSNYNNTAEILKVEAQSLAKLSGEKWYWDIETSYLGIDPQLTSTSGTPFNLHQVRRAKLAKTGSTPVNPIIDNSSCPYLQDYITGVWKDLGLVDTDITVGTGGGSIANVTITYAKYRRRGKKVEINLFFTFDITGTVNTLQIDLGATYTTELVSCGNGSASYLHCLVTNFPNTHVLLVMPPTGQAAFNSGSGQFLAVQIDLSIK